MEFQKIEEGLYRGIDGAYCAELVRVKAGVWTASISEDGVLVSVLPPCKTRHVAGALARSGIRQTRAEKGLDPHEIALRRAMTGMW